MVAEVALSCIILLYGVLCVFSMWWMANTGELAALKPASWLSKALYWHGVFIFGMLMLLGALMILRGFGRYLMEGW